MSNITEQMMIDLIKSECHTGDVEYDHNRADNIIACFLKAMGYEKLYKEYQNVEKWYA